MTPTPADLTLYSLTTDDPSVIAALFGYDEPLIVLGRDAADELAAELIARPDVLTVACEPLSWNSAAELAVFAEADCNGTDLHSPVMALAVAAGVEFRGDQFDPVAMLYRLRAGERAFDAVCAAVGA